MPSSIISFQSLYASFPLSSKPSSSSQITTSAWKQRKHLFLKGWDRERRQRRGEGEGPGSSASIGKRLKSSSARSVGFTLDHIYRACFRPSVSSALQVEVARKLRLSRRALERNAPTIQILKPLYDLLEAFYRLGYQISDTLAEEVNKVNDSLREATEFHKEDFTNRIEEASNTTVNDLEITLLKKQIKCAQKSTKTLFDITEVISIVKSAANRIQRERPRTKEDELEMGKQLHRDVVDDLDHMEDALRMVEVAENSQLPKEVSLPLKVCISRARRALLSDSAYKLLRKPLINLEGAIKSNNEDAIQEALKVIDNAVDKYDSLQALS